MALTNLNNLSYEQYCALNITPFEAQPSLTKTGNPDPAIQINLGGWVGDNVMAFTIMNAANSGSRVNVDPSLENTLDINMIAGINPVTATTYWTVDCGTDNKPSNWTLSYAVASTGKNGTWVFTKGKLMD